MLPGERANQIPTAFRTAPNSLWSSTTQFWAAPVTSVGRNSSKLVNRWTLRTGV